MGPEVMEAIAGISSVADLGLGIGNTILGYKNYEENKRINELNYGMAKDVMQWQKDSQARTWSREDSAIARRVADLKAAGLSPVLAAGSGASTSSPIHLNAPQMAPTDISGVQRGMMSMGNIAQTLASLAATNAQVKKTEQETILMRYSVFNAEREKQITVLKDLLQAEQSGGLSGRDGEALRRKMLELAELGSAKAESQKKGADAGAAQRNLNMAQERGVTVGSSVNDMADLYKFVNQGSTGQDSLFLDMLLKVFGAALTKRW